MKSMNADAELGNPTVIFLRLYKHYCKSIKGYSHLAAPLTYLLNKYTKWDWSSSYQKEFKNLKMMVIMKSSLTLSDITKSF